jgi:hypothetical protein
MKKVWFSVLSFIFFTLLLSSPILSFAEDPNEVAYQNRYSLRSGTILNSEGKGDCLIFPYYDVRTIGGKHQITEFQIQNVGEYGIAAKLRIREWSRGREVFSKDIWIPSSGVWTGTIVISDDGTNAVLMSSDHVILRYDSSFFYLSNPLSDGSPFSTKYIHKNNGESTLYGYIEVIGEEKTSPKSVIGKVGRLAKSERERDCPNTLKGKTVIRRVEDGVSMGYDAAAIGNFSRGQGSLFRSVGSTFPRLDIGEDTLDQSEFQLSKCEIRGSYSLDPSTQSRTSMIVTFPTRHFHYRNGNRINQVDNPFETPKEMGGEIVGVTLSEEGEKIADSEIDLPFSVNVIGLYKEDTGSLTGIDNVFLPTGSSELGEAMLTSDSLSQRFLIPDFENYFAPNQGRFMMYKGLPAVGLILQESQNSGTPDATINPVGYSRCLTPSNVEVIFTPTVPSGPTTFGFVGTSYTFTTSGGLSSLAGHSIQYQFDWKGDGKTDLSSWGSPIQSKTWTTGGVFAVKVRARCATHTDIVSKWSNGLVVVIESVSPPTLLSGPVEGIPNQSYSFTASGAFSTAGHPLNYQFDWGDGTTSEWGSGTQSKIWTVGGPYNIKARARCATHTTVVSDWTSELTVTIEIVSVPSTPVGPNIGDIGGSYSFTTGGSTSNLGHPVEYQFDWGDGTFSLWGSTTRSRSWNSLGDFVIKARARCVTHPSVVSDWSSGLTLVIEVISTPSPPTGPINGIKGIPYSYTASGAISSSGHTLQYQFDWKGDGVTDLSLWGGSSQTKVWTNPGIYTVKVRARCSIHQTIVTGWSSGLVVVIESVNPPTALTGPASGTVGEIYPYVVGGASSDSGDPVQYQFDWGDGTTSGWLSVIPGEPVSAAKAWGTPGTYTVRVQARCSVHTNVVSDWSAGLTVTISTEPSTGETVLLPSPPTGPTYGTKGVSYSYTTSGSISSSGHPVEYQFDWGTGIPSSWGGATQSTIWSNSGPHTVRVRARCQLHPTLVTQWSAGLVVVMESVFTPITLRGEPTGTVGEGYDYFTGGSSSDLGHAVQYQFDWGDGKTSEWLPVGTTSVGKAWVDPGTYIVRAHARCAIHGTIISGWSQEILVTINPGPPPQAETISTPFIEDMLSPDRGTIYEVMPNQITGRKNIPYTFGIQDGVSNLGHTTEHQFDWGDRTFSEWGGEYSNAWATSRGYPGYIIKVRARCAQHPTVVSGWSSGLEVLIDYIKPPDKPSGPTSGTTDTTYTYSTGGSTSEIGQKIQYRFHWGNSTDSGWLPVGTVSANKMWTIQGTYTVRVDARGWDFLGADLTPENTQHFSDYSEELSVKISKIVVESVSKPYPPTGPASGVPGTLYTYSTGGSVSNLGHSVQYKFDWGDGTDSDWLPVGTTTAAKSWLTSKAGGYKVKVRARCAIDTSVLSEWTSEITVTIESVSIPSTPVGPSTGVVGTNYTFMTGGATSSIGDPIEYLFDWGDGTFSSWGSTTQSRSWNSLGDFVIKARARCVTHPSVVSDWSSGLTLVIEVISTPSPPTGPLNGIKGIPYAYSASGAISSSNHTLEYQFDWKGDGVTDLSPWGGSPQTKVWTNPGIYTVKVRARCSIHQTIVTGWSSGLVVVIEFVNPPTAPTGPTSGTVGEIYPYVVGGASSDSGDPIQYQFDWGDGTNSGWLSVGVLSVGKTWANPGTYTVKAKARCAIHTSVTSDWSTGMGVTISTLPPSEVVSAPQTPVGPNSGDIGTVYSFSTGGSISTLGHPVEYQFDWGDGSFSPWGSATQSKSWNRLGTFIIKARARCVTHPSVVSDWSSGLTFVIETISTPSPPTGPTNGIKGIPYSYSTSGAISSSNDALEYQFDWNGDGTTDLSLWGGTSQSKAWTVSGTYTVRVRARSSIHQTIVTGWSQGLVVVIEFVNPPTTLTGPASGTVGEIYAYVVGGASSDRGDQVQYLFDWGDGTNSGWLSVGVLSVGKTWANAGAYTVKARARCFIHTNVISDWSTGITVTISTLPPSEVVSAPQTPVGPNSGDIGTVYSFSTGGSISTLGHPVEYQFDWGDGSFSPWGSATQSKSWNRLGTFIIKARARCVTHPSVVSDWSSGLTFVIETISTPSPPTGPTNGIKGIPYSYSTSGAISSSNDALEYQFDWNGDGTTDLSLWGGTSQSKAWTVSGTYTVRVRARSSIHQTIVTGWSQGLVVVIEFVNPPTTLTGPASGTVGEIYAYVVGGASSDRGDQVQYLFDWGDGTNSGWLSVGVLSVGKTWANAGAYTVKARARCFIHTNVISDWSTGITVNISTLPPSPEVISAPNTPVGPNLGDRGIVYSFSTGGSISTFGHPVEYQFDWGDGSFSPWGSTTQSRSWNSLGDFVIKARARCVTHPSVVSDWSSGLTLVIEVISTPSPPTGPLNGIKGIPYSYTASGAISSSNHTLQYQFDWNGDGTTDLSPWGGASQTKVWTNSGIYTVRVRARCSIHQTIVTGWSSGLVVVIEFVNPPTAPTGPTSGTVNEVYAFVTNGSSSDLGHLIQYQFDWGDGTNSGWLSVGVLSVGKTWANPGTYTVKAKARCSIHTSVTSDWSTGMGVTISTLPAQPESISTPETPVETPDGRTLGNLGTLYSFSTGGSISTLGHSVEYQFDWGDGTFSSWGPPTRSNSWNTYGAFLIKARARCVTDPDVVSDWSIGLAFAIEMVTVPSQPSGPVSVMRGQPNTYTAIGAISNLDDPLEYQFDWKGDGTDLSAWIVATMDPETFTTGATAQKIWTNSGTYNIRARARCSKHPTLVSNWSSGLVVIVEFVNSPVTPAGSTNGTVGTGYSYTTGGSSSDRVPPDPVQYQFDWGDEMRSEWLPIGTASVGKAWTTPGTYTVRAHARCGTHTTVISEWSPVLTVTIVPGPTPQFETISTPFIEAYMPMDRGSIYTAGNIITGRKDILYSFVFSRGVSNLGHTMEHQFDWGDGTFSEWGGPYNKAWETPRPTPFYTIKVRARCNQHPTVVSDWSSGLYIVIDYITTPGRATWDDQPVDGLGHVGVTYNFSTPGGSTSEINQEIQYRFHWGDATNSDSGWLPVGTKTASYMYAKQGTYTVRVDARGWWYLGPVEAFDPVGTEHFSYYSQELMVTIRP